MKLNRRDLMVLLNSMAVTADIMHGQQKGEFPNSLSYETCKVAQEFFDDEYTKQPYLTFREMNDLFTRLTNEAVGQDMDDEAAELLSLPPTEFIM